MTHRIAVPAESGLVASDINKSSHLFIYDIEENEIIREQMSVIPDVKRSDLPDFLNENTVNEVILNESIESVVNSFLQSKISVVVGAPVMNPRMIVEDYLLQLQQQHGHHHHHEGDSCGCGNDCGCH